MRDDLRHAGGWIAGTRYNADYEAHRPHPLPVTEAAGYEGDLVTVPGYAFDPPATAAVKMQRQGRAVYAVRETADEASRVLADHYNDLIAKRKGAALHDDNTLPGIH